MTYFLAGTLRSKCCRDHTPTDAAVNRLEGLVRGERYTCRESEHAIKGNGHFSVKKLEWIAQLKVCSILFKSLSLKLP